MYTTVATDINGQVHVWGITSGNNSFGGIKAKMAASLAYNAVVLCEDGRLHGEVLHFDGEYKYEAQPDIANIKSIFGGLTNMAAIDADGKVYIWGEYEYFKGRSSVMDVPENLPPIVQVVFGYIPGTEMKKATALGADGRIYEWGGEIIDEFNSCDNYYTGSADVYTIDELYEAVQNKAKDIYIKADMSLAEADFAVRGNQTLHIAENVIFSVYTYNFGTQGGDIINNGNIRVFGRMYLQQEPTKIGDTSGSAGEITYSGGIMTLSDVKYILDGDSPYNSVSSVSGTDYIFVIDEDYTLKKGDRIWLNSHATLKVAAGVTFTVEGEFETYNTPIIEGTVIGNITVYN